MVENVHVYRFNCRYRYVQEYKRDEEKVLTRQGMIRLKMFKRGNA